MPEVDWGCLWVWGPNVALQEVEAAVTTAYEAAGCTRKGVEEADPLLSPLTYNSAENLGADDVIIAEDECGWIAVMSLRHEWAPPGRHPLAVALAGSFEVLSIASLSGRYVEYAVYRDGALAEILLRGSEAPDPPRAASLQLDVLARRGGFEETDLQDVIEEPLELAKFAGCEWTGHRMVFETMTLEDLGPDRLFVFR